MNDKPEIKVGKLPVITKFIYTLGVLPTSYLMSMTYQEQVTWLYNYLQTQVIPAINTDVEAVQELQSLYELLRTYVNDYFDNLDVQEEINNKLDEMVEAGTLQEIIADYLNSKAVFGFDNVASMKESTNLIDGSYAKTLGYYEKGDKGSALYKIRELQPNETYNEENLIEISNNLVAEYIQTEPFIIPQQFGAYGDGTHDDTQIIQDIVNLIDGGVIIFDGTYLINGTIEVVDKVGITFKGIGENTRNTHFTKTASNSDFFKLDNSSQIRFEKIRFSCSAETNTVKGISFEIVDTISQDLHRLNAIHIEECFFSGLYVGVNVDEGSGYTYIKGNSFTSSTANATHLKIGKNFDPSLNEVSISYLYVDNNAFISNENGDRAIEIYNGHWLYFTNNDIANYATNEAIYITNEYYTNSLFIKNNSFFNVFKGIYAIPSANQDFSSIIIEGNNFLSRDNSDLLHFESNSTRTIRTISILNNHFENIANVTNFIYINLIGVNGFAIRDNFGQQDTKEINQLDNAHVIVKGCINGTKAKLEQFITAFETNSSAIMTVTPPMYMEEKPLIINGSYVHTSDKNFLVYVDSTSIANQTVSLRARDFTGAGIGAYTTTLPARYLCLQYDIMNNTVNS